MFSRIRKLKMNMSFQDIILISNSTFLVSVTLDSISNSKEIYKLKNYVIGLQKNKLDKKINTKY
jgi:hypothetical protein